MAYIYIYIIKYGEFPLMPRNDYLYMLNTIFISPCSVGNSLTGSTISTLLTIACNWWSNPHSDLVKRKSSAHEHKNGQQFSLGASRLLFIIKISLAKHTLETLRFYSMTIFSYILSVHNYIAISKYVLSESELKH